MKWQCHTLCDVEVSGYHAKGCVHRFSEGDKVFIKNAPISRRRGVITPNKTGVANLAVTGEGILYRVVNKFGFAQWINGTDLRPDNAHSDVCETCTCKPKNEAAPKKQLLSPEEEADLEDEDEV